MTQRDQSQKSRNQERYKRWDKKRPKEEEKRKNIETS